MILPRPKATTNSDGNRVRTPMAQGLSAIDCLHVLKTSLVSCAFAQQCSRHGTPSLGQKCELALGHWGIGVA